mgnify:CR=1 FL=1
MAPKRQYEPLLPVHRRHIAQLLADLAPHAADATHPFNTHASTLLSELCWYWSADGHDPASGRVKRDAFKTDWTRLHHTHDAHSLWKENLARRKSDPKVKEFANIQHDHAVPRNVLIQLMVRPPIVADRIEDLMSRLCRGVLVTKTEHNTKLLKSTMPPGWDEEDPYARYSHAGIALLS